MSRQPLMARTTSPTGSSDKVDPLMIPRDPTLLVVEDGTFYLADDLKHERKVALKVLKPEFS